MRGLVRRVSVQSWWGRRSHYSLVTYMRGLGGRSDGEWEQCNMIGPPDPVSNIRPMRFRKPVTRAEEELQRAHLQVWAFNHGFWRRHNVDFQESKATFVEEVLRAKSSNGETAARQRVTANELSHFYKQFLDEKFEDHTQYTKQWLRMNTVLTWLTLKATVLKLFTVRNPQS